MPRPPETDPPWTAILLRALLYAGAVTALVLFAPDDGARFIYVGF